jgi:hypothetical protein
LEQRKKILDVNLTLTPMAGQRHVASWPAESTKIDGHLSGGRFRMAVGQFTVRSTLTINWVFGVPLNLSIARRDQ